VTYSVVSGPATISGSTVTLTGVGTVKLQASQAANGNYAVATTTISFTVTAAMPTLTVASSSNPSTYGGSVTFTATISSGPTGTVTFYDAAHRSHWRHQRHDRDVYNQHLGGRHPHHHCRLGWKL